MCLCEAKKNGCPSNGFIFGLIQTCKLGIDNK